MTKSELANIMGPDYFPPNEESLDLSDVAICHELLRHWLKDTERNYQTDEQMLLTKLTKLALGEDDNHV